jgi:hypothetical protein
MEDLWVKIYGGGNLHRKDSDLQVEIYMPLPLIPLNCKAPHHDECIEFTLKSDPTKANSSKYKFQMHYLSGAEDMCSILTWEDDINPVIARMCVVNATLMYILYTQFMHGVAKSTFKTGVCMLTNATHQDCL